LAKDTIAKAWFRRSYTAALLAGVAGLAAVIPLLGNVPKCGEHWDRLGTCLQTTRYTCSPAAAATLLRKYDIDATEQEMAELCLTRICFPPGAAEVALGAGCGPLGLE
jgi:hypothetical protein